MSDPCWLRDGCPGKTAVCTSKGCTDDGCPTYRFFMKLFKEQGVMTEPIKGYPLCANCPLDPIRPVWKDNKIYCGACGKRIPRKINAHYCHKCGRQINWLP